VLFWQTDGFVESSGELERGGHRGLPVREYTVWL
jgi:hypothetical protein